MIQLDVAEGENAITSVKFDELGLCDFMISEDGNTIAEVGFTISEVGNTTAEVGFTISKVGNTTAEVGFTISEVAINWKG